MICIYCNTILDIDALYCDECGVRIVTVDSENHNINSADSSENALCNNCNMLLDDDALFCDECGTQISTFSPDIQKPTARKMVSKKGKKNTVKAVFIAATAIAVISVGFFSYLYLIGNSSDKEETPIPSTPGPTTDPITPTPKPVPTDSPVSLPDVLEVGNTSGNIANGGLAAIKGEWIYYNGGDGLYKINIDDTGMQKLSDDFAFFINIVGDWVYFIVGHDDFNPHIYRIKTDGSNRQELISSLSEGWVPGLYVVGDYMYFAVYYWEHGGTVYRSNTDGTNLQVLFNTYAYPRIVVTEEWIVYSIIDDMGGGGIFRVRTDSTHLHNVEEHMIIDYAPSFVLVVDDWIYYSNYTQRDNEMHRIRIDGTGKEWLNDEAIYSFNVEGEWIYTLDFNKGLYRINIHNNEYLLLTDDSYDYMSIAGDWVFYISLYGGDNYDLLVNRVRTDGSGRESVYSNENKDLESDQQITQLPVDTPYPSQEPDLTPNFEITPQPQASAPTLPTVPITIENYDTGLHIEIESINTSDYNERFNTWGITFLINNLSSHPLLITLVYTMHDSDGMLSYNSVSITLLPYETKSTDGRVWGTHVEIDLERSSFIVWN